MKKLTLGFLKQDLRAYDSLLLDPKKQRLDCKSYEHIVE